MHTNDTHGHDLLDKEPLGLAAVAQLKADYQAKGYEVLLLDAGDIAQGDQLVGQSKGLAAIDFFNEVGYDAMALGNHEFDYGQDYIQKYAAGASFPLLSANTIVDATGETLVEKNTVFTLSDGRKVGVFGLTTPETYTSANVLFVRGLTYLEEQELYDCAQAQVDELRKQGCDLVVCLAHLGEDELNAPNRASDVAQHVSGIDLIIDGHDHKEENATLTDASGNPVLVVETGCFTHAIGVVTWEDGKIAGTLVKYGEYDGQDATVAASTQKVADEVNESLGEVIGTTAFFLDGNRVPGVRTQETNLGDFVADAMLWEAQLSANSTPDAAFINGGGIRDSIDKGDITLKTIHNVCPFINYLCTVEVSGAQLLEAFEASCAGCPDESGGFPQVAGINFSIDTTVPYQKGENYPNSTHAKPANPGGRVTITRVGNRDYNANDTYVIASADFICNGGDTYYVFAESAQDTMEGTGYLMADVLRYYLEDACKGEMPEEYREAQGRITIKS
ncbi:MAG: 5'-nucleotidase C-terminal domain-containing protein [Coriobacteriales bacterium]|nr:5'-nucleotidase C-terminal domain-containing protein [Coriobacteriales bacterium]